MAHAKQISNPLITDHVGRKVRLGQMTGRIYDYDPVAKMWHIKLDTSVANVWVWAFADQFEFICSPSPLVGVGGWGERN